MFRKIVSLLVMTVAVSSQVANADVSARAPSVSPAVNALAANARSDMNGGAYTQTNAPRSVATAPFGNELLSRDAGLRSIASNHAHASHNADDTDSWLMLLVGGGLIVLQLRRKQKTLPQRPLIESENKLFWG
jgi:hypothetical protein